MSYTSIAMVVKSQGQTWCAVHCMYIVHVHVCKFEKRYKDALKQTLKLQGTKHFNKLAENSLETNGKKGNKAIRGREGKSKGGQATKAQSKEVLDTNVQQNPAVLILYVKCVVKPVNQE